MLSVTTVGPQASGQATTDQRCGPDDPLPAFFGEIFAIQAVVSAPGQPDRVLTDREATAYLQTWVPYSVFATPAQELPPADLPVTKIVVTQRDENGEAPLNLLFSSDGTSAWVGAPSGQPPPEPPEKWIRAPSPDETIAALNGELEPICVEQPAATTSSATSGSTVAPTADTSGSTATSATASEDSGDDGGVGVLTVVLVALGAAVAGAGVTAWLRRRGR